MFEVTADDFLNVAVSHNVNLSTEQADQLLDEADVDDFLTGIEYYDNLDDQTNSVYSEIEDWMMGKGIIPTADKNYH